MNSRSHLPRAKATAGFTIIEVLVVLVLTGIIVSTLTTLTGQWLRSWNRGAADLQGDQIIAVAAQRIAADLEGASVLTPLDRNAASSFVGSKTALAFVRADPIPRDNVAFDVVAIKMNPGGSLLRMQAASVENVDLDRLDFHASVPLLPNGYQTKFAYQRVEGGWTTEWRADVPPTKVQIVILTPGPRSRSLVTEVILPVQTPASCLRMTSYAQCLTSLSGLRDPGHDGSEIVRGPGSDIGFERR